MEISKVAKSFYQLAGDLVIINAIQKASRDKIVKIELAQIALVEKDHGERSTFDRQESAERRITPSHQQRLTLGQTDSTEGIKSEYAVTFFNQHMKQSVKSIGSNLGGYETAKFDDKILSCRESEAVSARPEINNSNCVQAVGTKAESI